MRDNPYLQTIEMLREKLEQLGWSQSDLARESGVSRVTINRVFNFKQIPDAATVNKLGTVLGFSPGQIAGRFLITGELMWNMIGAKKDLRDDLLGFLENYLVYEGFTPKQPLAIKAEKVDEIVRERAAVNEDLSEEKRKLLAIIPQLDDGLVRQILGMLEDDRANQSETNRRTR